MAKQNDPKREISQESPKPDTTKRALVSQTEFPSITLEAALRIAEAIWENFAGKGAAPHQIAMALDLSPTSGGWRNLLDTKKFLLIKNQSNYLSHMEKIINH